MKPLKSASAVLALTLTTLGASAQAQAPGAIDPNTGELVASQRAAGADCALERAQPGVRVVLHSAYEGQAVATATVAGQDAVTTHSFIDIERGGEPLYLVLASSTPMVWTLRGDTGRVRQVALVAESGAGVVGAPAGRVRSYAAGGCFRPFHEAGAAGAGQAAEVVARAAGGAPASVSAAYAAEAVSLPSGRIASAENRLAAAPAGFDARIWAQGLRFHPAGVAQVNAAAVAGAQAQAYQVLPSLPGLAQLAGRGALEAMAPGQYRIRAPIARFPAGLTGAQAARFQLAQGVAAPSAAPGHSCIVAAGGRVVGNARLCAEPVEQDRPTAGRY